MLALSGVPVSTGVGAAISIEVQAAMGRDLLLLVNITLLVAFLPLFANLISDFANRALSRLPP